MDSTLRLESYQDPSRTGFQTVMSYLMTKKLERKRCREQERHEERLPCRVSGEELQELEKEFGWKLTVVDRGPTVVPYAVAKHCLLASLNRRIKAWDGEEVVEFDRDMMSMAVKCEGWVHSCRTYSSSVVASEYVRQEYQLLKAIEGRRPDISSNAANLMREVKEGGGARICLDASRCTKVADTLLVDLTKVDVSATQLGSTIAQHQAARAKVFFYFETDMYLQDEGQLTSMPGRYLIDRDTDLVHIFPESQTTVSYTYSYTNMVSYLLDAEVVVNGRRYLIEVHGSRPGVCFALLSPAEFEAMDDSEVETRFYRPSGEALTVVEHRWDAPQFGVSVAPSVGGQALHRSVVPTSLVEKVVGRLMSFPVAKITLDNARIAVRDNSNQVVTKTGSVVRPSTLGAGVVEGLAVGLMKHALRLRVEMEIEQRQLAKGMGSLGQDITGWLSAAVQVATERKREILDALLLVPGELERGMEVLEDYTVRVSALEAGYVVRNIVKKKVGQATAYRSVSYMPGGLRTGSTVSSVSSTDYVLSRARAYERTVVYSEMDSVAQECADIVEETEPKRHAPMTSERKELVEKMRDAYDAVDVEVGVRTRVKVKGQSMPLCSQEAVSADPCELIHEDYFQIFPELSGVDVQVRAHLTSAEERNFQLFASAVVVNRGYDGLAPAVKVRRSKVKTAGGYRRPVTQVEALLAISKRIANAPRAQLDRNFDDMMRSEFDYTAGVIFRSDWKQVVADRVDKGMWQSRTSELGRNVSKLDTAKVTNMLREAFSLGQIDMQRWKGMVKAQPKPMMSAAIANEHKGTQTIVYQESKMTNSYFSSILSEFHDTLDEVLRPNVRVNVRRDRADQEEWFNSWQVRRVSAGARLNAYETDISQCDKSHTIYNLLAYFHFLRMMGAPEELTNVWEVMIGLKTASVGMVGVLVQFFEQLTSGGFHTISLNSIVVTLATVCSMKLTRESLVTLQIVGDDGLVETVDEVDMGQSAEHCRDVYNLESKTFRVKVLYFCSRYYVFYDGYWFIVKDPVRMAESLGKCVSVTADLEELHTAVVDDLLHYDKKEVMDQLAFDVAERNEYKVIPRSLVRGCASLRDKSAFLHLYEGEEEITA